MSRIVTGTMKLRQNEVPLTFGNASINYHLKDHKMTFKTIIFIPKVQYLVSQPQNIYYK